MAEGRATTERRTSEPAVRAPRHVALTVVEEHGTVYLPGDELPGTGYGTPRRHELLAAGLVSDPDQKES